MPVRLVLLDRDGTLIEGPTGGRRYTLDPHHVRLAPGAAQVLADLNRRGIAVAVVTNQRAVALGLTTSAGVDKVHDRIDELLEQVGAHVDGWFVCPHDIGTCDCRKPRPGLVLAALASFGAPPDAARLIGDSVTDLEAAAACGVPAVGIDAPPQGSEATALPRADWEWASDLAEAVRLALAR